MHGDPIAPVILGVTSVLLFAVIGRLTARRLAQPTVLGELLIGILLGNLGWYLGIDLITVLREGPRVFDVVHQTLAGAPMDQVVVGIFGAEKGPEIARIVSGPAGGQVVQVAQTVDVFSRYGVIFLLFMVGLEADLVELRRVGVESIRVAIIGVVAPFILGYTAVLLLLPQVPVNAALFVATTLGATSIGISADVLRELGASKSGEGHIILGAAVCDDILGLIVLAAVSGIVVSNSINVLDISMVVATSLVFLLGAIAIAPTVIRFAVRVMARLEIVEAKMFTAYLFVMLLAWVASLAGLATIIGAFAAGILLSDGYFRDHEAAAKKTFSIRELIRPLEVILVPIFFILMGIQVKLESFMSWPIILLAAGLLVAAIAGKILSGLGAGRKNSKLVIGIGMLPRGEVGLVFAAIGRTLGVFDDAIFSAIVLMVIVTTVIAPPLLKFAINRRTVSEAAS